MNARYIFIVFLIFPMICFGQKDNKRQQLINTNAPESYPGKTDLAKIIAALNVVDRVEFSQSYAKGSSGNLTIPTEKTLDFSKGGDLINYTGTIVGNNTTIINPDGHQIFSATAIIKGAFIMDYPTPEMFGANGSDDITDHDAVNQFFQFLNICKHKEGLFLGNSRYRIDTTVRIALENDINFNGNNSTLYTSYRDVSEFDTEKQSLLWFQSTGPVQKTASGSGLVRDTLIVNNVTSVDTGMGVWIRSEYDWSEGKTFEYMSTVKQIIGTDTIILIDMTPVDLPADSILGINIYDIYKVNVKDVVLEFTETEYDTTSDWGKHNRGDVAAITLRTLFYPTLKNIEISNANYSYMAMSLCYRGNYDNVRTGKFYSKSTYGLSAGSQYYSTFRNLYLRTNTPPIAFTDHPSVGCKVYDSDLSSVKYGLNGNIGFDSHNSHSVEAYNCIIKGVNVSTGSFLFDSCTIYNTEYGGWAFSNRDRSTRSNPTIEFTNCKFILEDFESKPSYLFMPYINTKFFDTLGDYNLSKCIIENNANEAYIIHGDYSHEITKSRNFTIDSCVFKGREIKFSNVDRGTKDSVIISQPGSFFFTNNKYDSLYFDRIPYEWYENIYLSGNKPNNEKSEFIIKTNYHNANIFINNNTIQSSKPVSVSNIKQSLFFMNNLIETPHASVILFEDDTNAYVTDNIHKTTQATGGGFHQINSNYNGSNNNTIRSATKQAQDLNK